MSFAATARRRSLVFLTAGAMVAGFGIVVTSTAAAVEPCASKVTNLTLDSIQKFASGGRLKRYDATVNYPDGSLGTWRDQRAKILLAKYPSTGYPALINVNIGIQVKIGEMVKAQQPTAVAAINGDFSATPTIRGKTFNIARGPMVKNGRVIRADRVLRRAVGIDTTSQPFGGEMGVRGNIQSGTSPVVSLQGVNWQTVRDAGVTIYTPAWNASTATPRPAGAAEWVINGRNNIKAVRTSSLNPGKLGAPVALGTRVIAFGAQVASVATSGVVGTKVNVNVRQNTDSGVKLQTALGRGLPLIENGVAAPLGCDAYHDKSARPRTLIGWTLDGVWCTVTVPGKLFTGPGLRNGGFGLSNEAAIAKRFGLYNAYELDGGGSTTLYTRSNAGNWTRRDLYGLDTSTGTYEREVRNGVAFLVP